MMSQSSLVLVAEDVLSRAILMRLIQQAEQVCGAAPADLSSLPPRGGKDRIKQELPRYFNASKLVPHVVLVDLDKAGCAPGMRRDWGLASLPDDLLFRVAVRESEAWMLADQHGFSNFAGVPPKKIPTAPEALDDPKQTLLNIVRRSRNRRLVEELVPADGSRVSIGPLYNERLSAFVASTWDPVPASTCAPSLEKALRRVQEMVKRLAAR